MCKHYAVIEDEHKRERVYTLDYWKDYINDCGHESMKLELQKRDVGGAMQCKIRMGFEPECGVKNCSYYEPRNGKSGMCKNLTHGFIGTDKVYILHSDGTLSETINKLITR